MGSPTINFITSPSVSVSNGSKTVNVTGSVDTYHVYSGTVVFIGNNPPVEAVSGTVVDGSGNSTITLVEPWSLVTATNEPLVAFNSNEGLPEAIRRAREIGDLTLGLMNSFESLLNDASSSVTIDINGVPTSFVPYKYLENKLNSLIVSAEANSAMKKSDFDLARLNELNRFPVAGTVNTDFDSSFEFHQIDGWQNKFRIKANKTRIDGVWHDYGNTAITLTAAPNGLQNKDLVSADFADLAAAIVAGGTSLSQSYLNQRHFVYMVQEDIAAPNGLSTAYIQDPKNNIYSDDGVLRQRVFSFIADRLLESVEIHKSKRWTNTVNCMESLGWTLSADVLGQWEKDGKKAVGITIVQSRNQGAYHPSFNTSGTGRLQATGGGSANFWYESNAYKVASKSDCFEWESAVQEGNIGGVSGVSNNKLYDAVYSSDVPDNRMSVIDLPKKEVREKNNRKAISGNIRGFESVPFAQIFISNIATLGTSSSSLKFNVTDIDGIVTGYGTTTSTATPCVGSAIGKTTGKVYKIQSVRLVTNGTVMWLQVGESVNTVEEFDVVVSVFKEYSQVNPVWTDIIGDTARIAATFPDGVEGQWIPVIPSGVSEGHRLTRKSLDTSVVREGTDDNGTTWVSGTRAIDTVLNSITRAFNDTRVELWHYETQAHFTKDDVNSEVLDLGDVFAGFHYTVGFGNSLLSSLISEVGEGNVVNDFVSTPLTKYNFASGNNKLNGSWQLKHNNLNLAVTTSPTCKFIDYLSSKNNIAKLCYAYKQMVFDVDWGDNDKFEIIDNQSTMTDDNGNTVLYGTASFETEYFIIEA